MPFDRATFIAEQTQFYRNNFRRFVALAFGLVILNALMLGYILFEHLTRPSPQYFVTTSDGRLIEVQPLPPKS